MSDDNDKPRWNPLVDDADTFIIAPEVWVQFFADNAVSDSKIIAAAAQFTLAAMAAELHARAPNAADNTDNTPTRGVKFAAFGHTLTAVRMRDDPLFQELLNTRPSKHQNLT